MPVKTFQCKRRAEVKQKLDFLAKLEIVEKVKVGPTDSSSYNIVYKN